MSTFSVTSSILSEKELCNFIKEKYTLSGVYHCRLFRTGVNHTYLISGEKEKFAFRSTAITGGPK